jgi:uncharacterized protein YjbJ (UPF0337 family)
MNRDRVKGIFDELVGSAKRMVGKFAGNRPLEARGIAQQGKGRFRNALGSAKKFLHGTKEKAVPNRSAPDSL